ncbi:NAD(P)-binding protein [Viridothelium virens]|uniref:D-xylose 1-dehydrogenase (NADP(+), D-xylono-1,5-lactone-forming) n=1 Tax=Viridothelium virens TaxID=1048519 RepID=A0A6A6HK21_VIRVR|nr:NAD(P)-binding protein [Viridothelium virens]
MSSPLRWGILATGGIAVTFTKDLLKDPSTRGASDVKHTVTAAASSSSASRANEFLKEVGAPSEAKGYGSYAELVKDPNVDIVYVATPHSHHFQNAMLCLEAKKHVLCEKAFTTNAAQAKLLVDTAKKNNLFLMEAVWIRFFPICQELRKMASDGKIGDIRRVFADLSLGVDVESKFGTKHRMTNMDLAGGAMLDLGIYPITWVFQFLYHIQSPQHQKPPKVASSITKYAPTGADEMTSMIFTFPATNAQGIATTNFRVSYDPDDKNTAGPAIRIQGTKGEIQVYGPAYRPTHYRIIPAVDKDTGKDKAGFEFQDVTRDIPGHGMFWEADECFRCLKDKKLESDGMSWSESIVIMDAMDEVRKQNSLVYPEKIESTKYPLEDF